MSSVASFFQSFVVPCVWSKQARFEAAAAAALTRRETKTKHLDLNVSIWDDDDNNGIDIVACCPIATLFWVFFIRRRHHDIHRAHETHFNVKQTKNTRSLCLSSTRTSRGVAAGRGISGKRSEKNDEKKMMATTTVMKREREGGFEANKGKMQCNENKQFAHIGNFAPVLAVFFQLTLLLLLR